MDVKVGAGRTRNMPGAVIGFIRAYRARHHGETPSLGELADAVESTKPAVSRLLDRLERDGALVRLPGPPRRKRQIVLPDEKDRAVSLLRSIGYAVNEDVLSAAPRPPVTDLPLPQRDLLVQIDAADEELQHGGTFGKNDA